jgi:hypothetical protein
MAMTKTKTNLPIRLLPAVLIVLLSGTDISTENSFIDSIKEKLIQYNHDYYIEKTYLMTDKYVYRPGEDLWFKGFAASSDMQEQQSYSEDYFIKLLNSNGEEIIFLRYPLVNNQVSGRLIIPRSSIPGRYWLVAYTGWMKNRCPQETFRKEILISKYFEKRFNVEVTYNKVAYYPQDTLSAFIRIIDPAGNPIAETSFDYTIGSFNKTDTKGTGKTDIKGGSKISCVIPNMEGLLMLTIKTNSRKLSGDYTLIVPSINGDPDITFYPEGINMVLELKNTMAFRTVNSFGLPAVISGEITDYKGNVLQLVSTNAAGKGRFEYCPSADTCYLMITKPKGITKRYPLPMANDHGVVIRLVEPVSDSIKISIRSSDDRSLTTTYWVAVMGRKIVWSENVIFNKSAIVSIPKNDLKSGVLQVSVFNQSHDLVAERLILNTGIPEQLSVKTDHQVYKNRQRVNLLVDYSGKFNMVNLAISVSLRDLAYNSQLTGINTVIYSNACDTISAGSKYIDFVNDLDVLTTNYRDINWDDVLAVERKSQSYMRYDGLSGRVYDKKENLSQHAKVRVTSMPNYRSYETQSNENGVFKVLFGSDIIDYKYLNIDAYDAKGKVNLNATVDHSYGEELKNTLINKSKNSEQQKAVDILSYGEPDLVYVLRYGPSKYRKSDAESKKKYDPNQYANYTDIMDIIQDIKPYRLKNNKIIFSNAYENNMDSTGMEEAIIVINGELKGNNADALKNLLPSDITNISISTSLIDVHNYTAMNFNGVIEITTIQGMYRYRQPQMQISSNLLNTEREFYSPDYSIESITSGDNRRTLFWNPNIQLITEKSSLISFFTSDIKGVFYGHIMGIDDAGKPIEQEFTFKVE